MSEVTNGVPEVVPPKKQVCEYCNESSFTDCKQCSKPVCKVHVSTSSLELCAVCMQQRKERGISICGQPISETESCQVVTGQTCYVCHDYFCKSHASKHDPWMCSKCASDIEPIDYVGPKSVEIKPLVDDEGVTHSGKHIVPVFADGKTVTHIASSYVDSLSDTELESFLTELQEEVRKAERIMYSKIFAKSTVEIALSERKKARKRHDRAQRLENLQSKKTVSVPKQATTTEVKDVLKEQMSAMLKTPEGKKKMAELLKGLMSK